MLQPSGSSSSAIGYSELDSNSSTGGYSEFAGGDTVEVHGLLGAKELNGRWGRVVKFFEKGQRYGVQVDGVEEPKSIKAANLRKIAKRSFLLDTPMPAAFMESMPGTTVFRVLLQMLPAEALVALVCCRNALRTELQSADESWERAIQETFGGTLASARELFPEATSAIRACHALAALRMKMSKVEIAHGKIEDSSELHVEAIVYPANHTLLPYGPAARAVFAKAGEELVEHMQTVSSPLEAGRALWTPAFGLGVAGLIHAVGPDRSTPDGDTVLRRAYESALQTVLEHGHKSVAIASISTGGNGFSPILGAASAMEEIRRCLSKTDAATDLRIVVVSYDEDVDAAFRDVLMRVRKKVNSTFLEKLPVLVADSMLPKQQLHLNIEQIPCAVDPGCDRFAMLGVRETPRGLSPLSHGVEVHVKSRANTNGKVILQVVAGRRFIMPGRLQPEASADEQTRPRFSGSVIWIMDDDESETLSQEDYKICKDLEDLVTRWLELVRAGHERQPCQMDLILSHLGDMPPRSKPTERALWVCALINPLPGLGVAYEIRPAALEAITAKDRLQVALKGIRDSISHLDGSRPMRRH